MLQRIALAVAGLALGAAQTQAANVHFVEGPNFSINDDLTVSCTGKLAGLGNKDIRIVVEAEGEATVTLFNPAGQFVPGQNKIPVVAFGEVRISKDEIKNGNVVFSLSTSSLDPGPLDPRDFGAPNVHWHAVVTDIQITSATITVYQGGRVVLQETFP